MNRDRAYYLKLYEHSKPEKLRGYLKSHAAHLRKVAKEHSEQLTCVLVIRELLNRTNAPKEAASVAQ